MTNEARDIAKRIWQEMIAAGYGEPNETVTDDGLDDFISRYYTCQTRTGGLAYAE